MTDETTTAGMGLDLTDAAHVIARGRADTATTHLNLAEQVADTLIKQFVAHMATNAPAPANPVIEAHVTLISKLRNALAEMAAWIVGMPAIPPEIADAPDVATEYPAPIPAPPPLDPFEAYKTRTGVDAPAANRPGAAIPPAGEPVALAPPVTPGATDTPAPEGNAPANEPHKQAETE